MSDYSHCSPMFVEWYEEGFAAGRDPLYGPLALDTQLQHVPTHEDTDTETL